MKAEESFQAPHEDDEERPEDCISKLPLRLPEDVQTLKSRISMQLLDDVLDVQFARAAWE